MGVEFLLGEREIVDKAHPTPNFRVSLGPVLLFGSSPPFGAWALLDYLLAALGLAAAARVTSVEVWTGVASVRCIVLCAI